VADHQASQPVVKVRPEINILRDTLERGLPPDWTLVEPDGTLRPATGQRLRDQGLYTLRPPDAYALTVLTSTSCNLGCGYCFQNTGQDPAGGSRPPNRVALQVLDRDLPVDLPAGAQSALAVLLPRGAPAAELDAVYHAVAALRTLYPGRSTGRTVAVTGAVEVAAGDRVWREPRPGVTRLWQTSPPAVPDTRGHTGWTFTHAALLSLGFVWQGTLLPPSHSRGAVRDNGIVDAANAAAAVVLLTEPVRGTRVEDYVHRVHPDAVVRPYRATLAVGDLGGPTTIQAIGQCRHLGGGLLVPVDYTEGTVFDGWQP